jgi:toxin YoeB
MSIIFSPRAWEDYEYWIKNDKKKVERINKLIRDTLRSPFEGIGKPEPLKRNLQGFWSRRIDEEHRLIYEYNNDILSIISCRYHY